ncbi:MAG: hypothetical protein VYA01_04585 [Bacteroidota bacterium]|nr:hypothetical protein [Bacteroidota bacterium]
MNLNVLQKGGVVVADPYPHIIIEDALPDNVYAELERTFPENAVLSTEPFDGGICYRYKADKLLQEAFKPEIWRDFCDYHTSAEYVNQCFRLFEPWLTPQLQREFLHEEVAARGWTNDAHNIHTDCQLVMHKPITDRTSRTPHLDNPIEIYAGLLYMPHPDDSGTGGEFQIHHSKGTITEVNKTLGRQVYDDNNGGVAYTVPYKPNTFAMFLNTQKAIHSVSMRERPTQYRRSVNIIGEFKDRGYGRMWRVNELKK